MLAHKMLEAATVLLALAAAAPAGATAVAEPRTVEGSFDRVVARGPFQVEIREGAPAAVVVLAEPASQALVRTEVMDGALLIEPVKREHGLGNVRVSVTVPSLAGVELAGSGNATVESGPRPRDMSLAVRGSGNLSWTGAAQRLAAAVNGSGNLRVEGSASSLRAAVSGSGGLVYAGKASSTTIALAGSGDATLTGGGDSLEVSTAGSGSVDAKGFAVRDANVSTAGSGDVAVRIAGGTITASLVGSGDVDWTGEGKVGEVQVHGSGSFRHR